jgi:hypothetical protein
MICHVCNADAVGQCKNCLKFYCAEHGDVICVACAASSKPSGRAAPACDVARSDQPADYTGPTCYACRSPASHACPRCGQFCCSGHFVPGECDNVMSVCSECRAKRPHGCFILVVTATAMAVIYLIVYGLSRARW